MAALRLRPARLDEAGRLSALALRSKAHWGYDAVFLEQCRAELAVRPGYIEDGLCLVAEDADGILGFIACDRIAADRAEISHLFVAPEAIGRGVGRALIDAAVAKLEAQGVLVLQTASDPHAEAFYHRAGFRTVGCQPSESIPGRLLPTVRRQLAPVMPAVGE